MVAKILFQGAEAIIKKQNKMIIKDRVEKTYRYPELDMRIRSQRTKKELKLLQKASSIIPVPKIISSTQYQITLEEIKGKNLAQTLDKSSNKDTIAKEAGKNLAKLHDVGIIHGDLTTSNMIYSNKELYIIDFGLGFESQEAEHKAVDLHVLKEALAAKHPKFAEYLFKSIIQGYKSSKNAAQVITRLKKVELRGRYKQQY